MISLHNWLDKWGCLVTAKAVDAEGRHPDQEDSLHRAGHASCLGYNMSLVPYINWDKKFPIMRHPMTEYTMSRDNFLPFLMEKPFRYGKADIWSNRLTELHEDSAVEKDKWLPCAWLIRRIYHTPNGDIFFGDHAAVVKRCKLGITKWDAWVIGLGDMYALMTSVFYLLKGFDRHYVNHTLCVEFSVRVLPTITSQVNLKLCRAYGLPERVYN
jgi:hypothetical protein